MTFMVMVDIFVVVGNLGYGIWSIFSYKKGLQQNEKTAQKVLAAPETFAPLSEKSKDFINHEITKRGLDKDDFLLITCMHIPGFSQDYLTLTSSEHMIISLPSDAAVSLNILLEKETLTDSDKDKLARIKFFIGRNIVYAQRYFDNSFFSVLKWAENKKMLSAVFEVSFWLSMRYLLGINSVVILLCAVGIMSNFITTVASRLHTAFAAQDADVYASDDKDVLAAGATILRTDIQQAVQPLAQQAWFGLLWSLSEKVTYLLGTGMFHPESRAQAIEKRR